MSSRKFIELCQAAAYKADAYGERERSAKAAQRALDILTAGISIFGGGGGW